MSGLQNFAIDVSVVNDYVDTDFKHVFVFIFLGYFYFLFFESRKNYHLAKIFTKRKLSQNRVSLFISDPGRVLFTKKGRQSRDTVPLRYGMSVDILVDCG